MDYSITEHFKEVYFKDLKYTNIIKTIFLINNAVVNTFLKPSYLFDVDKKLIYNIYDSNCCLYILYSIIKKILKIIYNKNYYFSIKRIINFLKLYVIYRKLYLIKKYFKYCLSCGVNKTNKQLLVKDLRFI
jgi:hypothetical protein